jgi:uncharacterized protein involved in outer membrane biogenesis
VLKIVKNIFASLLLVYAVVGFIVLPYILKPKLTEIVSQETNARVEIGSIYINPFLFKVEFSDVVLRNLDDEELLRFKEFFADVELYSLARKAIHLKEITLLEPKVSLTYNADKTFNILNILKEKEKASEDTNSSFVLPRVILDSVSIKGGELDYKDFTLKTPFHFSFTTIGFYLKDVDTDESKSSNASLRFYTTLGDGGFLDFKSNMESLSPLKANGTLDFEASKLYTEWKYVQDILNLEVADGKISFQTKYIFDSDDINATKIEELFLSIEKLRIKPKEKYGDVFNIEKFSIQNATILPFRQSVDVEKVSLDGLSVLAKRNKESKIDWIKYVEVQQDNNISKELVKETEELNLKPKPWSVNLKDVSLENINLKFEDGAVFPRVDTQVSKLNFYAQNITLLGEKAFTYEMNMQLNKKGKCNSKGKVAHADLYVQSFLECQGFDIVHYNPYIEEEAKKALKRYNLKLKKAFLNFNANTELQKREDSIDIVVSDASVALNNFHLNKKNSRSELVGFSNFLISGIDINTTKRSVDLEKMTLNGLKINIQKYKSGSLNVTNLIEAKKSKKSKKQKTQEKPYSIQLKHFALNSSNVEFKDYSLEKTTTNRLRSIYANAYDIDLRENSWLRYDLGMRINSKGSVKTKGKLRHTPLKQSGSFDIKNISLIALTPYLQESAYVSVEDGKLSLKGKTEYEKSSQNPDLRVEGSLLLDSFFVNDTLHNTQLLSLGELRVKSYTFEVEPNRLHIDEVDVNSFYVDASIDENKTLNFSELMKKRDENVSEGVAQVEVQGGEKTKEQNSPFPYRILKVNVALGSAKFADYSIPIKFSTHIHDLGGTIYAISNSIGDTTYVDIAGEVDKYASTKLKGSIDSANPKAYTDLDFNFKNLDLNSFSGYSANFAGHEIDSGKLYLDLGYDILDSELLGSNSVVIKKIKLGDEVDDENVTVLPLGFLIGLLEDSDGIIDIDMPVEGNLDAPDFKYGALVFKTFGNLIAKAVTSPFKFLGAAMGMDTEELQFIAYEPGLSEVSPPQREKLDKIAELMLKKPKIILGVAGVYDLEKDKEALQLAKLIDLVVKKSGIKNIKDHESVMSVDMLEDIYEDMRDDDILSQIQEKLHLAYKEEGAYDRAYQNELIILCRDLQIVSQEELKVLANTRADNIISYLIDEKMLGKNRLEKKPVSIVQESTEEFVKINMEIEVK